MKKASQLLGWLAVFILRRKDTRGAGSMTEITSLEALEECLANSETESVLILKHSTACPVSYAAYSRFTAYLATHEESCPKSFLVKVIESRPVSNAITKALGVQHQSPQLLLVRNRKSVWSVSHGHIEARNIDGALAS